jgi:hypothetical protein
MRRPAARSEIREPSRSRNDQVRHRDPSAQPRQSVNAALHGFQRRGWIEVHDRAVTIKQAAALGRFAGHEVSAS